MTIMKKAMTAVLCGLVLLGCGTKPAPAPAQTPEAPVSDSSQKAGGWTVNQDVRAAKIDPEVQEKFDKAMEGMVGSNLEIVAVLGTQVVAGTNYALLLKSTPVVLNAESHFAIGILYADLEGNAEFRNITDIDLGEKDFGTLNNEELAGGWTYCELEEDGTDTEHEEILKKACENHVGSNLTYITCLGTQVVAGTNYAFLCSATVVAPGAKPAPKIVYVYQDLEGKCSILDICDIDPAKYNN